MDCTDILVTIAGLAACVYFLVDATNRKDKP